VNWALILEPEAEAEIAEAGDWYNQQSPALRADFLQTLEETLAAIQENPFQYQVIWKEFRRAGVARFPYGLIYRASNREITVVACFHGRRNPKLWKKRT